MTNTFRKKLIGKNIRSWRRIKGMSLLNLSEKSKVSKGCISQIENKPCNITIDTLYRLADAMSVNIVVLITDYTKVKK